MNISRLFIERPIMTSLVMLAMLLFGIGAYFNLPVSDMPAVDFPTIQVTAAYSGASPDFMASSVASPLEREFAIISGLDSMNSQNVLGKSTITLQFALDRDIDDAAMDVQAAINRAQPNMPSDLTGPPSFTKVNPAAAPVVYISVSSKTLPLYVLNDYAKTYITETLSMISGVSQVNIYGEKKYSPRIDVKPLALASRGMTIDEVRKAVVNENVNLPLGNLESDSRTATLMAKSQLTNAKEYQKLIVSYRNGQPVRLEELAIVSDGVEKDRAGSWMNNEPHILLAITRQAGSNTIAVVDAVKAKLPVIQSQLPASVTAKIIYDKSRFISDSVSDVKFSLALAVGLVILVVFAFLRSATGTIIAGLSIPFSIVATFTAMYAMGYTLDNLSLMALTLSVGFVVDDAIVMLENIFRHAEQGKAPRQASLDGAGEIGFTIISVTLSLAVVFMPLVFMSGILGRILREFAMTITLAVLISGVVAVTLVPMLSSRLLTKGAKIQESGRFFDWMLKGYKASLRWAIDHRGTTMLLSLVMFAATVAFFIFIPKGFLPPNDIDMLQGFTQARQGISFPAMRTMQRSMSAVLHSDPDVSEDAQVVSYPMENQGMSVILLKPQSQRKTSAEDILHRLRPVLNREPGLSTFLVNPPIIPIGGKQAKGDYVFTLQATETEQLYAAAAKFERDLLAEPTVVGVNSDLLIADPQLFVDVDRDRLASYGITFQAVEDALYSAFGERQAFNLYGQQDVYKVIMALRPEYQKNEKSLSMLYLRGGDGQLVRLDSVATVRTQVGPATVNHTGQLTSVSYYFSAAPGVPLSTVTQKVTALAKATLPDQITYFMEGTAQVFAKSLADLGMLLIITIFVIYVLLGCLYESYVHPLTILSGLPSAALGGLLILATFGLDLNLYGFVGIIMLIGIVKKNSIMVVDFAIQAEKEGKSALDAAFEGSLVRFRPIMMTTIAAIMGALPIALGMGAGAEARRPMGLVVVGGLVLSQVVTLYLTPVFYTYMDQFQRWCMRRGRPEQAAPEA